MKPIRCVISVCVSIQLNFLFFPFFFARRDFRVSKKRRKVSKIVLSLRKHDHEDEVCICFVSFIRYGGVKGARCDSVCSLVAVMTLLTEDICFPDTPRLNGQQRVEEFQQILLRLTFPSFYNSYGKSCCKLYPGGCYKLLDSAGYTCELLKGRVTITENDGWIQFQISNVQFVDGGYYRCFVLGTQNYVYSDYYFEVSGKLLYDLHWCHIINISGNSFSFVQLLLQFLITAKQDVNMV